MFDFSRFSARPLPALTQEPTPDILCRNEPGEPLVDLCALWYKVKVQPAYAQLPGARTGCWLRRSAAERLLAAAARLPEGYTLLVWDAWRPVQVQQSLYDAYYRQLRAQNPRLSRAQLSALCTDFVARPREDYLRPAPHATGGAVDLTLCKDGVPLDMGTEFDDFTPLANTAALEAADSPARANRRILFWAMAESGFVNYPGEWWHFCYGDRLWAAVKQCPPLYSHCPGAGLW